MNRWKIRRSTVDIILLIISFYEITGIPHFLFLLLKYVIILRLIILYHKECKKKEDDCDSCVAVWWNYIYFNNDKSDLV